MELAKRVALVCAAVPAGRVVTYGQIALLCGRPRAARQVGRVLGRGGYPAAHRVVNHAGRLSGAAAFLVPGLQRSLLEADGVPVSPGEAVDLACFGWRPAPEEQARLEEQFRQAGV